MYILYKCIQKICSYSRKTMLGGEIMNHDDIKKMQEVASRLTERKTLEVIEKRQEELDAKMRELRQEEIEQAKMLLEELLEEEREEAFMVLD